MTKKELIDLLAEQGLLDVNNLKYLGKKELIDLAMKLKVLVRKSIRDYVPMDKQMKYHCSPSHIRLVLGGNRSGKTVSSFHDVMYQLTGDYPEWYPDELKLPLPVYSRWIATDFKYGIGAVFQIYFDTLIPNSCLKRKVKTQQGIISKVFFNNGSILDLMTNEQDIEEFEGWAGHRLHIDEPCSRSRYIASKRGLIDYGGKVSLSLTPLSEPWIYDELYENPDNEDIFVTVFEMRENKHISVVEIDKFEKSLTDDEKEARLYGKFVHLTGSVYKEFDRAIHVIENIKVEPHWRIVHILDPHDRKPHANLWAAIDEFNNYYIIDELESTGTLFELNQKIRIQEFKRMVTLRIMDPNKAMSPPKVGAKGSIKSELGLMGLHFYTNVNDKLDVGHLAVKRRLYYDKTKPVGIGNRPTLYIDKKCVKTIRSMTRYIWADNKNPESMGVKEKPKDIFKDLPDCIRYLCVADPVWEDQNEYVQERPKSVTGY